MFVVITTGILVWGRELDSLCGEEAKLRCHTNENAAKPSQTTNGSNANSLRLGEDECKNLWILLLYEGPMASIRITLMASDNASQVMTY